MWKTRLFFRNLTTNIKTGHRPRCPPPPNHLPNVQQHNSRGMPRGQLLFEEVAGQRLPLGGVNGYLGIRGKQGRKQDKYQGVTPKKKHRTKLCNTPLEAAIALAQLNEDIELDTLEPCTKKIKASEESKPTSKKFEAGTYLGHLPRARPVIPTVACALLSPQQAAAAVTRGVAVAYADHLA